METLFQIQYIAQQRHSMKPYQRQVIQELTEQPLKKCKTWDRKMFQIYLRNKFIIFSGEDGLVIEAVKLGGPTRMSKIRNHFYLCLHNENIRNNRKIRFQSSFIKKEINQIFKTISNSITIYYFYSHTGKQIGNKTGFLPTLEKTSWVFHGSWNQ